MKKLIFLLLFPACLLGQIVQSYTVVPSLPIFPSYNQVVKMGDSLYCYNVTDSTWKNITSYNMFFMSQTALTSGGGTPDWSVITNKPNAFSPSAHGHSELEITNLTTDLAGKSAVGHTHVKSNVTDFAHSHIESDITGLVADLAGKQASLGFAPENAANKNTASGYAGLNAGKLTASQGQEVWSASDLTTYTGASGNGTTAIQSTITTPVAGQALKWDGANWTNQADAAGGLSGYASVKRLTDTTFTTNTPVNISGMSFAVTGGTYYSYRFIIIYQTAALTTGIKLTLTYPAVTVASAAVTIDGQAADGATTEPWVGTINSSGDVAISTAVAVVNVPYVAIIEGNILPSASGALQLQFSSEVAANATLKQGSVGYIWSF